MYLRCPACKDAFRIGIDELNANQGEVQCPQCQTLFNASSIPAAEQEAAEQDQPEPGPLPHHLDRDRMEELDEAYRAEKELEMSATYGARRRRPRTLNENPDLLRWIAAALALLALLGVQVYGFEGQRLAQNAYVRPTLEGLCSFLGCDLAPFKDTARIQVSDRALDAGRESKEILEFRMVFSNQSTLAQPFPDVLLVLDALDGHPLAERVFAPMDYLPDWQEGAEMPVGKPFEVRLTLAKPGRDVGGFSIDFQ